MPELLTTSVEQDQGGHRERKIPSLQRPPVLRSRGTEDEPLWNTQEDYIPQVTSGYGGVSCGRFSSIYFTIGSDDKTDFTEPEVEAFDQQRNVCDPVQKGLEVRDRQGVHLHRQFLDGIPTCIAWTVADSVGGIAKHRNQPPLDVTVCPLDVTVWRRAFILPTPQPNRSGDYYGENSEDHCGKN